MAGAVWMPDQPSGLVPVRQVYAFVFAGDGRVLVQDDAGRHNLPGGTPEAGESDVQTLAREVLEESQVRVRRARYIGYRRVGCDGEVFAQLRFAALVDQVLPVAQDVSTGRTYGRLWVPPPLVNDLLGWGRGGRAQVDRAACEARALGAPWCGAPLSDAEPS